MPGLRADNPGNNDNFLRVNTKIDTLAYVYARKDLHFSMSKCNQSRYFLRLKIHIICTVSQDYSNHVKHVDLYIAIIFKA